MALFLLFLTLALSPTSFAAQVVQGKLDRPMEVIGSDGRRFKIEPGPVKVELEEKGYLFGSKFKVTSNGESFVVQVPKSSYSENYDVDVPYAKSGQPFSLVTKAGKPAVLKRWEEKGPSSCSYSGYCTACSAGVNFQGQLVTDCSFKFNLTCSGQQEAVLEKRVEQEPYELVFQDEHGRQVAKISAAMSNSEIAIPKTVLGECGESSSTYSAKVGTGPQVIVPEESVANSSRGTKKAQLTSAGSAEIGSETSMSVDEAR